MSDLVYLEDNGKYPHSDVTISIEEFRDSCDTNARSSILRTEIISILREQLEKQKNEGEYKSLYSIKNADISIERVCNIMGFMPTYERFLKEEQKMRESEEE